MLEAKFIMKNIKCNMTVGKVYKVYNVLNVIDGHKKMFEVIDDEGYKRKFNSSWFNLLDKSPYEKEEVSNVVENNEEEDYLYKEFNIKKDNLYMCECRPYEYKRDPECATKRIKGVILNFSPSNNIVIKSDEGLHIIDYRDIKTLHPIK